MKLTGPERAYLAGICDGEGTITLRLTQGRIVVYAIAITNSNADLILAVGRILKKSGVKTYLSQHSGTQQREGRKCVWQLLLAGIDNTKLYLNLIYPYLHGKKQQAALVMKFLASRRSGYRVNRKSPEDVLIYEELRRINARGTPESVETARSEHSKVSAMIQSELHGDVQSVPETSAPPLFKTIQ